MGDSRYRVIDMEKIGDAVGVYDGMDIFAGADTYYPDSLLREAIDKMTIGTAKQRNKTVSITFQE